jgi:DNA-binding LacI/PurR family transcriptional regulator
MMFETAGLQRLVPKRDRIKAGLRAFIRDLPPGAALPPILALCEQFQVSRHTIDRVVGDLRAEGLLESRRGSGIYVAQPAKTLTIGILSELNVFARNSGFYGLLTMALHQCAPPETMRLRHYFFSSSEADATSINHLHADVRAGHLDGIIGLGTGGPNLQPLGLPYIDGFTPDRVELDYGLLVRLAVEALVLRGRQRIALFYHDPRLYDHQKELARIELTAFQEAMSSAGLLTPAAWLQPLQQTDRPCHLWGREEWTALWQSGAERPDGLVCVDDQATLNVLFAAEMLGMAIPDDLLIASHANSLDPLPNPAQVIRVEFDTRAIARALLARLHTRISGQQSEPVIQWITPCIAQPGRLVADHGFPAVCDAG